MRRDAWSGPTLLSSLLLAVACTGAIDGDDSPDAAAMADGPAPTIDADPGAPDAAIVIDAASPVDVSSSCSLPGPGSHTLTIVSEDGSKKVTKKVSVKGGQEASVNVKFE